jgi:hypothetical protein
MGTMIPSSPARDLSLSTWYGLEPDMLGVLLAGCACRRRGGVEQSRLCATLTREWMSQSERRARGRSEWVLSVV